MLKTGVTIDLPLSGNQRADVNAFSLVFIHWDPAFTDNNAYVVTFYPIHVCRPFV